MAFEANQGQWDEAIRFIARRPDHAVLLTNTQVILSFRNPTQPDRRADIGASVNPTSEIGEVRLRFLRSSSVSEIIGLDQLPGKVNYFIGNDPANWRTDVSTYSRVRYTDVYPGVDLLFYGSESDLEYDLIVAPGADPSSIEMELTGTGGFRLNRDGHLELDRRHGAALAMREPYVYQDVNGGRLKIDGRYKQTGENQFGFELGSYNPNLPLIIDPVLVFSTFLGGSQADEGLAIAVDGGGNAYITGSTESTSFSGSASSPFHLGNGGGADVFVAKLNSSGTALQYLTYIGGSSGDAGFGISVDTLGNAYVAGYTIDATNPFPVTAGAAQTTYGGGADDGFALKLSAAGNALLYSTYLGGNGYDRANAIVVDSAGRAFVAGETGSNVGFLVTGGAYQTTPHSGDGFVARLNPTGSSFMYSTLLGGATYDMCKAITIDPTGNAYVTGRTKSTDFPRTVGPPHAGGDWDVFVTKLNSNGTTLDYSRLLGGVADDYGSGIALDSSLNAFVTGYTSSNNFFVTTNAYQGMLGGVADGFVAKVSDTGNTLIYSTYLGGNGVDAGSAIAVDSNGNTYLTGYTGSNFISISPLQSLYGGGNSDVFVTQLDPAGIPVFSTYLGGSSDERPFGIALHQATTLYITGYTDSSNFPTVQGSYDMSFGGGGNFDGFVSKISVSIPCVPPPNTTMVAWYPFDETMGVMAANLATGNSGTLMNSPAHVTGMVGSALRFDGMNDYVESPSTIVTNIGPADLPQTCSGAYSTCQGDFTIDAWVKVPTNAPAGVLSIVSKLVGSSPSVYGYGFGLSNKRLGLILADGGSVPGFTNYASITIQPLYNNQWHHVAVSVKRRTLRGIRWYFDGNFIGFSDPLTAPQRFGSLVNNSPLRIGVRTTASGLVDWFKGDIDELEIFNRVLNDQEILAIFNAGPGGKCK